MIHSFYGKGKSITEALASADDQANAWLDEQIRYGEPKIVNTTAQTINDSINGFFIHILTVTIQIQ